MRVIGAISFIRGWVILTRVSKHAQPGTFGKGLTHVIAGILAINIYETWEILMNTLGLNN